MKSNLDIVELTTGLIHNLFQGTYESIWDVAETDDHGNEIYTVYKQSELMESIAKAYEGQSGTILSEMQDYGMLFVKDIVFTGGYDSPREYNFTTDKLHVDVLIDLDILESQLRGLEQDKEFAEFLHDNYTSRDGFWSFTPDTWEEIHNVIVAGHAHDRYEQAIGAVMSWYMYKAEDKADFYNTIESIVWEDWNGNGYEGLDYHAECWDCGNEVDYDHDFECQNKDCDRYKLIEKPIEGQMEAEL